MSGLITDNPITSQIVHHRIGFPSKKLLTHLQPVSAESFSAIPERAAADAKAPFTVVWPHRIDREKRPDTLTRIADECKRRKLNVSFEVWGSAVLNNGADPIEELSRAGVIYRGPFRGGLSQIEGIGAYDALLLTSQNEGLPNVLIEAQLARLPIIASNVGGVSQVVRHMESGILTEGPDDISGYVNAIETLMNDRNLGVRLTEEAYVYATSEHSWDAFNQRLEDDILKSKEPFGP